MVEIHAHPGNNIAIGRRGENEARRVSFDITVWRRHYGEGTVQLLHQRAGDESPYPCALTVEGDTVYWLIRAADVDKPGWGNAQLHYYVGDTLAKSAIWPTVTADALSDPSEPPEDPARAWFAAVREQIGNLDELTTEAKDNLVAAINEAAKSGGGGGSVSMRVDNGYIQYSTDGGASWDDLIAMAELRGTKGDPGDDGTTPHIGDNGNWYLGDTDTGEPSRGPAGAGMDITGATVGQIAKITSVDDSGKPTAWEAADMPSGGGSGGGIHRIARVVTEANAASIEVTGLSTTAEVLSLRIYKPGSTCGTGLNITVNGVQNIRYVGTIEGKDTDKATVRVWLYRDGDTLYGRAIMENTGINVYNWPEIGEITSITVGSPHNDGTTKYFQTGTIFEIYEGVYPNVN